MNDAVEPVLPPPVEYAREAGLRYVSDDKPGITRKRHGDKWDYFCPDGKKLTDHNEIVRINRLAIPPAWTDVWICPRPNGHLQATGRDARGRKQYRYHTDWRKVRDEGKFEKMIAFSEALPKIRARVEQDLALPGLPREKVLATVVRLLETTLIRVGNDEYAKENKSFGLTTMRNRHVKVAGSRVKFSFRGKSGVKHAIDIKDPRLAKVVKRCQELPGHELFEYIDDDGGRHDVGSADVNQYLQEITAQDFTAKDFRTWAGTVLAAIALKECEKAENQRELKKNVTTAVEAVSKLLGNTPAVCRKCYVHPAVLESYLDGSMIATVQKKAERKQAGSELKPEEAEIVHLLQARLAERS